jgi:hypothetical protein
MTSEFINYPIQIVMGDHKSDSQQQNPFVVAHSCIPYNASVMELVLILLFLHYSTVEQSEAS